MKREFLQNFKVGDQALPKEAIDAIMAENGKDIEEAKKPFADYATLKKQNEEYAATVETMKGKDTESLQSTIKALEDKISTMKSEHAAALAARDFDDAVTKAITKANGKNAKAIKALLDLDALKSSKNQEADISAAIESCQKENTYLFGNDNPPPYSAGAGAGNGGANKGLDAIRAAAGLKTN